MSRKARMEELEDARLEELAEATRAEELAEAHEAAVTAALAAEREAALRDVFATAALGSMLASQPESYLMHASWKPVIAKDAYAWADAMVEARKPNAA